MAGDEVADDMEQGGETIEDPQHKLDKLVKRVRMGNQEREKCIGALIHVDKSVRGFIQNIVYHRLSKFDPRKLL